MKINISFYDGNISKDNKKTTSIIWCLINYFYVEMKIIFALFEIVLFWDLGWILKTINTERIKQMLHFSYI